MPVISLCVYPPIVARQWFNKHITAVTRNCWRRRFLCGPCRIKGLLAIWVSQNSPPPPHTHTHKHVFPRSSNTSMTGFDRSKCPFVYNSGRDKNLSWGISQYSSISGSLALIGRGLIFSPIVTANGLCVYSFCWSVCSGKRFLKSFSRLVRGVEESKHTV
jgi:hypothetical protein